MSSSITARHGSSVSRVLPASLLLLLATACDPLSCQGRLDTVGGANVVDVQIVNPLCEGNTVVFNGDVDITNQAELDAVKGCTTINGVVLIHDSTDIVDLSALDGLLEIKLGYLLAINNTALKEISLPSLIRLESGFAAIDNPVLERVLVPELPLLGGDLTLRNSPLLTQVNFAKVQRLDNADFIIDGVAFNNVSFGNMILADLPALKDLTGAFAALEVMEGALDVQGTGLTSFKGFERLREILNTGGAEQPRTLFRVDKLNPGLSVGIDFNDKFDIVKNGNPALVDFTGLEGLDTIVGDVFVGFNPALTSFDGLDDLATIDGDFFVAGNESLEDFTGLEGDGSGDGDGDGLSTITGNFFIGLFFDRLNQPVASGNADFTDFSGLENLVTIGGDLVVAFNSSFDSFSGLTDLTTIGGDLVLLGCEPESLAGMTNVATIGGSLVFGQFFGNDGQPVDPDEVDVERQFLDVDGVEQDPGVKFDSNDGDNGFTALTTVTGNLVIAFSNFEDLRLSDPDTAVLATVGGSLILYGNENPNSLAGLDGLTNLGGFVVNFAVDAFGDLQPFENDGLADFSDLGATNLGAGGLHIGFNGDLDDAAFASFPDFGTIGGDVTLARVVNQNNLGPANLANLNATTIVGNLTLCAIKNGDDAPINADLGNLDALNISGVDSVGGDVFVGFCSNLTDTSFTVQSIGGSFELTELPDLVTINGINQLATAGELLLHDLAGVENVSIPALGAIAGNLEIVRNPSLAVVDFNLNSVDGTIRIANLDDLPDLNGLSGLTTVGGDLDLIDLPQLENTAALNSLTTVVGALRLRRLDNVVNVAAVGGAQDLDFPALTSVGSLEIVEMGNLADLAGLQTLGTATDAVIIARNPKLTTLFGLQGLTTIGRKLSIRDNLLLDKPFFDDDNFDREEDVQDNDGVVEPEDFDTNFEVGLINLVTVGSPVDDDGVTIGGSTGVIELRNNEKLDQADFLDEVIERSISNYEGLIVFCGNLGSNNVDDADARLTSRVSCDVNAPEEEPADEEE